ncbi:DUF1090 domain-containing protein [Ignatzschineria rhizosphaerae]|uniref:DUF1090 domain-containing protein n=1 Tax=Ignatzschineria rhizosphaerae TaxID=2923279 RepID=A0ABY3WZ95_9GAMM|nr:DUF1090 family protein [Ignatzschineria rhizosphaerae]UNM95936.1 DUF1090 domain-containing protein [Ignatzschineria rhizosphaerae]
MKKLIITTLIFSSYTALSTFAYADYGCEKKLAALENQLSYAKRYNNTDQISGLERAIDNVKTYCGGGYALDSPEAKEYYKADQKLEVLEKIADAKKDLAKAEYKLEKAKRKSDYEDQLEAEYKIKEAQGRIDMYQKHLNDL